MAATSESAFTVLIPAKDLTHAKSRLHVEPARRRILAAAFLADAVAAASRAQLVKDVVVLTPDALLGGLARSVGASWRRDPVCGDLNASVRGGVHQLTGPVAVMVADLPSLDARELDSALGQLLCSEGGRLCVVDRHGRGTTLLAALAALNVVPQFGVGSAARHSDAGFTLARGMLPGLRIDVDTLEDLSAAAALASFGQRTARAVRDPWVLRPEAAR